MSTLVTHTTTFVVLECWACGMQFAITHALDFVLRRKGDTFCCPKGCRLFFGESEVERVRKVLAKTQAELDQEKACSQSLRLGWERTDREKAAVRGHLTRLKRRIANGVCPCCQRAFRQLSRHMKTQHPEYERTELA